MKQEARPPLAVLLVVLALLSSPLPGAARVQAGPVSDGAVGPVRYTVSFPNRLHHEAEVEVRFRDIGPGPLELRMSRTSPGRYALHEFAKNVYDVRVSGAPGTDPRVSRPDPHQWDVTGHGGEVTVRYTLYADRGDGTYSQVDESHAHLNVPATFMFARGLEARPVELTVELPPESGWSVATQLFPTADGTVFTAPDRDYFMDSPLEMAALAWRRWTVPGPGGEEQEIRVAMHHLGSDADLDRYARHTRIIGDELAAMFGGYPRFDSGTYTFLACYLPWASGDGMEHRNSTVLTSTGSLDRSMTGLLGTVAHEFVHAWSMERIRPASLEPFDFEAANMSRELWFGEGFTSYLDDLALVRAGVIGEDAFLVRTADMATAAITAPGRRFFSPVEMSLQAPFVDAATSVDPTNRENTFLSYYTWGSAIGLGLDLTLRTRFPGLSLEDLLQELWRAHGDPEVPYTVEDVEDALSRVTGDRAFAGDFFRRYVRGREVVEYAALFREVGVRFVEAAPEVPILTRASLRHGAAGAVLTGNSVAGDPLYRAGVSRGDRIRTVAGRVPTSAGVLEEILASVGVGGQVEVVVEGRGRMRTVDVVLQGEPGFTAYVDPEAPRAATVRRGEWIQPGS